MKRNFALGFIIAASMLAAVSGCSTPSALLVTKKLSKTLAEYKTVAVKVQASDEALISMPEDKLDKVWGTLARGLIKTGMFQNVYDYDKGKDNAALWMIVEIAKWRDVGGMSDADEFVVDTTKVVFDVSFVDAKTKQVIGGISAPGEVLSEKDMLVSEPQEPEDNTGTAQALAAEPAKAKMTKVPEIKAAVYQAVGKIIDFIKQNN